MRKLKISITAQQRIQELFEYLEGRWSSRVRIKFAKKLYDSLNKIRNNPELFPKSEVNKKLHKCVVSKQTILFYRFTDKQVFIVSFFDTRQDPTKIKKIK